MSEIRELGRNMKALVYHRYGGPEVLNIEDIPVPDPLEGEVLIEVHCVALNPYDWHFMRGEPLFMRMSTGLFKPTKKVIGNDTAGVVAKVGQGVTGFKPGDAVLASPGIGALAGYVVVKAAKVCHKPENLSFAEAATIPIAAGTARASLEKAGKDPSGKKIFINGASGGVGTFTVQLAKLKGMLVTAVCSTAKEELVKSLGADVVIDYKQQDVNGADLPVEWGSYDLVIDNVGNLAPGQCRRLMNEHSGSYMVGFQGVSKMFRWIFNTLTSKKFGIIAPDLGEANLGELANLMAEGKLKPIMDRSYPLDKAAEALAYVEEGHSPGKVVVNIKEK